MALPTEKQVADILRVRGAGAHLVARGSEGLLTGWSSFVAQVEAGYSFGLDDYRNDLDLRSVIALTGLDEAVTGTDARFRQLLTHTETEIWNSDAPNAWWTLGYPANSGPVLLTDLQSEGLL